MSCIVVCFCELDDDLPAFVSFCDEHRLGASRNGFCVSFVTELDLVSGATISEGGDVGKKSTGGDDIEIHPAIKRFQLRDTHR